MIKAVITDVDGVIIGKSAGVNFPLPHNDVIEKLQSIRREKIPVVFCSSKAGFTNIPVILACKLNNPHIVDGGSVILDAINNIVIEKHMVPPEITKRISETGKQNNFYQEFYTPAAYFILQGQNQETIEKRTKILGRDPIIVPSTDNIPLNDIIKIQQLHEDSDLLIKTLQGIEGTSFFLSAPHPTLPSLYFAVLTAFGISKRSSAQKVLTSLGILFEDTLGIGDSENDWEFMSLCKYVGVMGNAQEKLKELAKSKGEENYFIGPSVEENGILKIFEHFKVD